MCTSEYLHERRLPSIGRAVGRGSLRQLRSGVSWRRRHGERRRDVGDALVAASSLTQKLVARSRTRTGGSISCLRPWSCARRLATTWGRGVRAQTNGSDRFALGSPRERQIEGLNAHDAAPRARPPMGGGVTRKRRPWVEEKTDRGEGANRHADEIGLFVDRVVDSRAAGRAEPEDETAPLVADAHVLGRRSLHRDLVAGKARLHAP